MGLQVDLLVAHFRNCSYYLNLRLNKKESKNKMNTLSITELPGIDASIGLKSAANKESLYRRLLAKFPANQGGFEQEFSASLANGDMPSCQKSAHTLKGLAGTLGMVNLMGYAADLEKACADQPDSIEAHLKTVVTELNKVLDGIARLEG